MTSPESPQPEQAGELEFENVESFERYLRETSQHGLITAESGHCVSLSRLRRFYDAKIFPEDNLEYPEYYDADLRTSLDIERDIEDGKVTKHWRTGEKLSLTVPKNIHKVVYGFILGEINKPMNDRHRLLEE